MPRLSEAPKIGTYEVLYRELCKNDSFRKDPRVSIQSLEEYIHGLQPPEGLGFEGVGITGIVKQLQLRGYVSGFHWPNLTLVLS